MNNLIFNNIQDFDDVITSPIIHIRIQMRNARKCITLTEGLLENQAKDMIKYLKKYLSTNGTIKIDDDDNIIVQLNGDKRQDIKKYLLDNEITDNRNIYIHGF